MPSKAKSAKISSPKTLVGVVIDDVEDWDNDFALGKKLCFFS